MSMPSVKVIPNSIALLVLSVCLPLHAAERVALVIGNGAYSSRALPNPPKDAVLIGAALKQAGFSVTVETDLDKESMRTVVREFYQSLSEGDTALFYYAGHGAQAGGQNYLVPVDAPLDMEEFEAEDRCYKAQLVLGAMEQRGTALNVVVLDCCRDNPFTRSWRSAGGGGMLEMKAPQETLIAYATAPGKVALDGRGDNSPYSQALADEMLRPGVKLEDVFKNVARRVHESTGGAQRPWTSTDLLGAFYFVPESGGSVAGRDEAGGMVDVPAANPGSQTPATITSPGSQPAASASRSPLDDGAVGKVVEVKLPGDVLMKFSFCPPGNFMMGSPASEEGRQDDENQVPVRITRGYWMAQTECTQGQWAAVMGSNPSAFKEGNDLPVETVSWEDAQGFLGKLGGLVSLPSGWKFALPTEAQWEYACRAGTESVFNFGDVLNGTEANCNGNYPYGTSVTGPNLEKTAVVGSYRPNGWGLHDMHGNVREWCVDWYAEKLSGGSDPTGSSTGVYRVWRGGSWGRGAAYSRSSNRDFYGTNLRGYVLGFRAALIPSNP